MKVSELKDALGDLHDIYDAAGARKAASDIEELTRILDGHEHESVDAFLDALRDLYDVGAPPTGANGDSVDQQLVDHYVAALKKAVGAEPAFMSVLNEMRDDRRVRKVEANAIQHAFIGGRKSWPSRKAAIAAIEATFKRDKFQDEVLDGIKGVRPW